MIGPYPPQAAQTKVEQLTAEIESLRAKHLS